MALVFVHGVAARQTPENQAATRQRDDLFLRLIGDSAPIFDPDWGSNAVKFYQGGWVPTPGDHEQLGLGGSGPSTASAIAARNVPEAVDLAFVALLNQRLKENKPLGEDDLAAFEAAVKYLQGGGDKTVFDPNGSDAQFAQTLKEELKDEAPPAQVEALAISDVFTAIGGAVKQMTDPIRNIASDGLLRLVRKPLSNKVALFLGDIFVYLRYREADKAIGTYNRIFAPIIEGLADAAKATPVEKKLLVIGHSLGAVILYDLLRDPRALQAIRDKTDKDLSIDALVTVGAQPGLFADMGLYDNATPGKLPRPACVKRWLNVFDYTDVLSFQCAPFFEGAEDFAFDNVSVALDAHSAYFQRPRFYERLQARLAAP